MYQEIEKFVKLLKEETNSEFIENFKACSFDELINFHFSLGIIIRNNYLSAESKLYRLFCDQGIKDRDEISMLLIKLFYLYLNTDGNILNI